MEYSGCTSDSFPDSLNTFRWGLASAIALCQCSDSFKTASLRLQGFFRPGMGCGLYSFPKLGTCTIAPCQFLFTPGRCCGRDLRTWKEVLCKVLWSRAVQLLNIRAEFLDIANSGKLAGCSRSNLRNDAEELLFFLKSWLWPKSAWCTSESRRCPLPALSTGTNAHCPQLSY